MDSAGVLEGSRVDEDWVFPFLVFSFILYPSVFPKLAGSSESVSSPELIYSGNDASGTMLARAWRLSEVQWETP